MKNQSKVVNFIFSFVVAFAIITILKVACD